MLSKNHIGHVLEIRNELFSLFMGNAVRNLDDPKALIDEEIGAEVDIQITMCQEHFQRETGGVFEQTGGLPPEALMRLLDLKSWVLEQILLKYDLIPKKV